MVYETVTPPFVLFSLIKSRFTIHFVTTLGRSRVPYSYLLLRPGSCTPIYPVVFGHTGRLDVSGLYRSHNIISVFSRRSLIQSVSPS